MSSEDPSTAVSIATVEKWVKENLKPGSNLLFEGVISIEGELVIPDSQFHPSITRSWPSTFDQRIMVGHLEPDWEDSRALRAPAEPVYLSVSRGPRGAAHLFLSTKKEQMWTGELEDSKVLLCIPFKQLWIGAKGRKEGWARLDAIAVLWLMYKGYLECDKYADPTFYDNLEDICTVLRRYIERVPKAPPVAGEPIGRTIGPHEDDEENESERFKHFNLSVPTVPEAPGKHITEQDLARVADLNKRSANLLARYASIEKQKKRFERDIQELVKDTDKFEAEVQERIKAKAELELEEITRKKFERKRKKRKGIRGGKARRERKEAEMGTAMEGVSSSEGTDTLA